MTNLEITFLVLNVAAIVMVVSFVVHLIVLHQNKYEWAGYLIRGKVFGTETVLIRTSQPDAERAQKALAKIADDGSIVAVERVYRVANR